MKSLIILTLALLIPLLGIGQQNEVNRIEQEIGRFTSEEDLYLHYETPQTSIYTSNGKIRKAIHFGSASASSHFIEYFNEEGSIIKLVYYYRSYQSGLSDKRLTGLLYFENDKVIHEEHFYEYDKVASKRVFEAYTKDSKKAFQFHSSTKSLQDHYSEFNLETKKWLKAEKGSTIKVSHASVNLRSKPNANAVIVGQLQLLEKVKVLELGETEKISPYGLNRWYKVELTDYLRDELKLVGWVYGAFL